MVDCTLTTALMHAAAGGNIKCVEMLLYAGADKTLRNTHDRTAESEAWNVDIADMLRDWQSDWKNIEHA